jgi:multidrug resistance protein MdtO
VYRRFGEMIAQSDVVPFETGPMRAGDMAARDKIRRWQASLRTFNLVETPLLQFRLFTDQSRKSKSFTSLEDELRGECSRAFLRMADNLERQLNGKDRDSTPAPSIMDLLNSVPADVQESFTERERALLRMSRTIAQLLDHMQSEVVSESLYSTPAVGLTGR